MKTEVFAKTISNVQRAQKDVPTIGNAWLIRNGAMESLIALTQVTVLFPFRVNFIGSKDANENSTSFGTNVVNLYTEFQ